MAFRCVALDSLPHPRTQRKFGTVLADPPWQFQNRTGKVAPEHQRLARYETMSLEEIMALPVAAHMQPRSHLWLWTPNALLPDALQVLAAWGFTYKTNLVWHKVRKDGGSDGRGCGFYLRNVTELLLLGVRGGLRTLPPGRRQVNYFESQKREHSRKPDEIYALIEQLSPGPYLEMFSRAPASGLNTDDVRFCMRRWTFWGKEAQERL